MSKNDFPLINLREVIDIHLKYNQYWYVLPRSIIFMGEGCNLDMTDEDIQKLHELGWGGPPPKVSEKNQMIIDNKPYIEYLIERFEIDKKMIDRDIDFYKRKLNLIDNAKAIHIQFSGKMKMDENE